MRRGVSFFRLSWNRDPYIIHLSIALSMVVSPYFGGKSHVSNLGKKYFLRSPVEISHNSHRNQELGRENFLENFLEMVGAANFLRTSCKWLLRNPALQGSPFLPLWHLWDDAGAYSRLTVATAPLECCRYYPNNFRNIHYYLLPVGGDLKDPFPLETTW